MTGGTSSRGGAGGVYADVEDLRRTARRLGNAAADLGRVAGQSRGTASSGALLRTAILSPGSAAGAQGHLLEAALSAQLVVAQLGGEALYLVARADLFVLADAARERLVDIAQDLLVVPVLLGVSAGTVIVGALRFTAGGTQLVVEVLAGRLAPSQLDDGLRALPGRVGSALAGDGAHLLSGHPELVDVVTGGLPTVLQDTPLDPLLPDSIEGLIALAQGIARLRGYGRDGQVHAAPAGRRTVGRQSLASIIESVGEIGQGATPDRSGVRIKQLPGPPPSWIVEIPGTSAWNPRAGGNPSDLTQNAELMQGRGALLDGVRSAMAQAGIGPDDPVLLAGHSQGGIAAAALAARLGRSGEYRVTNVLTAGSPVAHFDIPRHIQVLSLEHRQDPVPRLDEGDRNPDRPNWQTITIDVGRQDGLIDAHAAGLYSESAATLDTSGVDGSFARFLGQGAAEQQFDLSRERS